jgi:hypothetical protein
MTVHDHKIEETEMSIRLKWNTTLKESTQSMYVYIEDALIFMVKNRAYSSGLITSVVKQFILIASIALELKNKSSFILKGCHMSGT